MTKLRKLVLIITSRQLTTVEYRFNAVQYNMILHSSLKWLGQNIYQNINPQKTPHSSPAREDFGENWPRYNDTALYVATSLLLLGYPLIPAKSLQLDWRIGQQFSSSGNGRLVQLYLFWNLWFAAYSVPSHDRIKRCFCCIHLWMNFNKIWNKIQQWSYKKMRLKCRLQNGGYFSRPQCAKSHFLVHWWHLLRWQWGMGVNNGKIVAPN